MFLWPIRYGKVIKAGEGPRHMYSVTTIAENQLPQLNLKIRGVFETWLAMAAVSSSLYIVFYSCENYVNLH